MSRLIQAAAVLALPWLAPHALAQTAARVRCVVVDGGVRAPGELALEGSGPFRDCDDGLTLPPGTHRIVVRRRDTLAGGEVVRRVRLEAEEPRELQVEVETGELLLWTVNGAKAAAATAEVWHDGRVSGRLHNGRAARLGVGTYVVDARLGNQRRRFGAVHVAPRGRTVLVWQTER